MEKEIISIITNIGSILGVLGLIIMLLIIFIKSILIPQTIKEETKDGDVLTKNRAFEKLSSKDSFRLLDKVLNIAKWMFVLGIIAFVINLLLDKVKYSGSLTFSFENKHGQIVENNLEVYEELSTGVFLFYNIYYDGSLGKEVSLVAFLCVKGKQDCLPKTNPKETEREILMNDNNNVIVEFLDKEWIETQKNEGNKLTLELYVKRPAGQSELIMELEV